MTNEEVNIGIDGENLENNIYLQKKDKRLLMI